MNDRDEDKSLFAIDHYQKPFKIFNLLMCFKVCAKTYPKNLIFLHVKIPTIQ